MPALTDVYLYQRKGAYVPRIAAVHDLCGYGKCSLGVAIPVLSAAGCDVCPVPTSLFSAHTKFPTFYMHDTTDMLSNYLDAWREEHVDLDAIYSGFLGSAAQVAAIKRLYREYPQALRIVDPVMGDGGKMYPTYTEELCAAVRELVDGADLLTPNLTEASLLTGIAYEGDDVSDEFVRRTMDALLEMGAHYVVLKGVVRGDGQIRDYVAGRDAELTEVANPLSPIMCHGTGDLYASSFLAALMCDKNLFDAAMFANQMVRASLDLTLKQPDHEMRGVSFEAELGRVCALLAH